MKKYWIVIASIFVDFLDMPILAADFTTTQRCGFSSLFDVRVDTKKEKIEKDWNKATKLMNDIKDKYYLFSRRNGNVVINSGDMLMGHLKEKWKAMNMMKKSLHISIWQYFAKN